MSKNFRIGIIGLGQIGNYLYHELNRKKKDIENKTGKKINIIGISAKNKNKKRKYKINKKIFYSNPFDVIKKRPNVIFEVIGSPDGISRKIVETSLKNGIHVITPNKALIAKHGNYLTRLAEKNNVNLEFEASVAGGIPILRTLKEDLSTNKINKVSGILNGTTNYILTEMENTNQNFKKVLYKAQKLGYAEPINPKLDLNGFDAFAKVRILSSLSFNSKIASNKCLMEGIENIDIKDIKIANQLGMRIKLLGLTELINGKLFERVHPCLVDKKSYIGNVNGVMNAVIINGEPVGENILQGEGAGPGPTSSSLLSDLMFVLRGNIQKPFGIPYKQLKQYKSYNLENYSNSLYLRFEVKDVPGVMSKITDKLAKFKISIKRLIQTPGNKSKKATIIMITHKTTELNIQKCLKIINKDKNTLKPATLIRIFN